MKPTRIGLFWAVLMLAGFATTAAHAWPRGNGYSSYGYTTAAPCYSNGYCAPPTYGHAATSYGPWAYWAYPSTGYYYRVRYAYYGGHRTVEDDGWLYTGHDGCYTQYMKIADYLARPATALVPRAELDLLGSTQYGVDAMQNKLAQLYGPKLAGLLLPQGAPKPQDLASILPPYETLRSARMETLSKSSSAAATALAQIAINDQDAEREEARNRHSLAMSVGKWNAFERAMGKFAELSSVDPGSATYQATAPIQVSDPALAAVITQNCLACHGGSEGVKGGIDFRQCGSWDKDLWKRAWRQVACGKMPKGQPPLDDASEELFEAQYERAKAAVVAR